MPCGFRKSRPAPETDLQNRVNVIILRAKGVEERLRSGDEIDVKSELAALAYSISYLAGIVYKHLQTREE